MLNVNKNFNKRLDITFFIKKNEVVSLFEALRINWHGMNKQEKANLSKLQEIKIPQK